MGKQEATELGLAKLREIVPSITDLRVISSYHSGALLSTSDGTGRQLRLHKAIDAWTIQVSALEKMGGPGMIGYVVIDTTSKTVKAASLLSN